MTRCDFVPVPSAKACSGKCMKRACRSTPRVWIIAACEGMVSLFEKSREGAVAIQSPDRPVFSSLEQFQHSIEEAGRTHEFDQLILIGSNNDIAWIHSSLPESAARHIAAEIRYPLFSGWFREPPPMLHLSHALQGVMTL